MGDPADSTHLTGECRMLLEHVRDGVLFVRVSDGKIIAANKVAEDMYGYSSADLLEKRIFDLVGAPDGEPGFSPGDPTRGGEINEDGVLFEADHRRADGTVFPVETSARVAVIDDIETIVATVRDISRRKNTQRVIQEALAEVNQILDVAADGIRIVDLDFNVTRANNTFLELAQIDSETALSKKCYESFAGSACHTPDCTLVRALRNENKLVREIEKKRVNGSSVVCTLTAQPFVVDGEILGVIEDFRDISEFKAAEEIAQHLATHDPLTALPNRLLFNDRLEVTIAQAKRGETHPALMYCDVDRFKAINDTKGHIVGDNVLQSVAGMLAAAVREEDTVARIGGDEFVVLLPQVKAPDDALTVARKILKATEYITAGGEDFPVTLSVGVAVHLSGENADDIMRRADRAMYSVKERGGNGLMMASDEDTARIG